jgi:cell division protease FtsH
LNQKNYVIWALVGMILLVAFNVFYQQPMHGNEISYTEFLDRVKKQQVAEVLVQSTKFSGSRLSGRFSDGSVFSSYAPDDPGLVDAMLQNGVTVKAGPAEESPWYVIFLTSWAPMILLILFWVFFMRQMQGGGGKTMSFGRARARMLSQESAKVTFESVAGVDEAKEELSEVVDLLANPK